MHLLRTIRQLFLDAKGYSTSSQLSRWKIFKTLFILYSKSKFSSSQDSFVFGKINQFIVCAYDYPTLIQLYREIFLERVYEFRSEKTTAPFIVDCGSNIGISVLFFKECYPDSKIWAFEPNPNAYELLLMNIQNNNLKDVLAFNFALSDRNGFIDFFVPLRKGSLNGASIIDKGTGNKVIVPCRKLSGLLADEGPDFIKMDVEGDEIRIMNDLLETDILKSVRELVIEFHPRKDSGINVSDFISRISRTGFDARLKSPISMEEGGQDFIYQFKKWRN